MRLLPLSLAFAAVFALAPRAHADDHPLCNTTPPVVRGTVGYQTLQGAITSNALAYGAASLIERKILPATERFPVVFHYDIMATYGAVRAPFCEQKTGGAIKMSKVDLAATAIGVGYRTGPVTLYFAGSGTSTVAGVPVNGRLGYFGAGLLGAAISPIAPIKRRFETNGGWVITSDFIAGANLSNNDVGTVGAGYLASKGFFTNLSERHVRLFASAVLRDSFSPEKFPYLNAGISQFDWLLGDSLEKQLGYIAPSFRQTPLQSAPADPTVAADQLGVDGTRNELLRTLNLERFGRSDTFDFRASYAIAPRPMFYEASVTARSRGFLPERYLLTSKADTGGYYEWRVSAGLVNLPPLYYYGVSGGIKPRLQLDLMSTGRDGPSLHRFFITFGLNSTDTLAVFPFAYNAFQLGIAWNVVSQ